MDVFEALAAPVRRALLEEMVAGPVRVVDLAAHHPISRPAVSQHLRLLVDAGLVRATDRGRERFYTLLPGTLAPARDFLDRIEPLPAGRLSVNALDALDTEVRRTSRDRSRSATGDREETA